ncbi:hypothetical protein V8D89_002937 [Ganoderma adspersum]
MFFEQGPTDEDEPIVLAITALKSLRSLTVSGWSGDTLRLLRHVSSPIRKLAINSTYVQYPDILEEFLHRFAPALDVLELLYFRVDRGRTSGPLERASGKLDAFLSLTQYPAVRSLSVLCFMGTPLVDRLQHLFPALDGTLSLGFFDTLLDTCLIDDVRSANQRAQEGSAAGVWKKLDRVVCDAPMLYALGLRCPIRLVMVDKGSADADTAHYAAAPLRENPVPRLKLTLACGRGMLDGIFTPQLAGTLSHLTLCLVHDSRDGSSGTQAGDADDSVALWDDLLDIMLTVLRPLHNLTHLRIVVSCKAYTRPGVPAESSSSFVASVRGPAFDFAGTAASLVRARPSLQYLFLTTAGSLTDRDRDVAAARPWRATHERWDVSRAWRVAGRASGGADTGTQDGTVNAGLVELHGDVAETIVRNEELVLSETDEATLFSSNLGEAKREVSGIGADE